MRFRPASINYLVDATSQRACKSTQLIMVIQRIEEGDRNAYNDGEQDANDENFCLRSVHSSDSDDFHYFGDYEDDCPLTLDHGNLVQTTDHATRLPSRASRQNTLLENTFTAAETIEKRQVPHSNTADTRDSPSVSLFLRIQWFFYLNQHRRLLSNGPARKVEDAIERTLLTRKFAENTSLIPQPILQVIHAIVFVEASNRESNHVTPTTFDKKVVISSNVQQSSIQSLSMSDECSKCQGHETQNSDDDKRRISELELENTRLRQLNHELQITGNSHRHGIDEVSPCKQQFRSLSMVHESERITLNSSIPLNESNQLQTQDLRPDFPTPLLRLVDNPHIGDKNSNPDHDTTNQNRCLGSSTGSIEEPIHFNVDDFGFSRYDDNDVESYQFLDEMMIEREFEAKIDGMEERRLSDREQREKEKLKKSRQKKKKKNRSKERVDKRAHEHVSNGDGAFVVTKTHEVSNITPEATRGQRNPQKTCCDQKLDASIDVRLKRYDQLKSRSRVHHRSPCFNSLGKAMHQVTPARTTTNGLQLEDDECVTTVRRSLIASDDDDGLEIPHESPMSSISRKRNVCHGQEPASLATAAKRRCNQEVRSAAIHVLCSESFIENSSHIVASITTGSWIEDAYSDNSFANDGGFGEPRIITHDSSLLDEIGIDMEISGKEAVLVTRLSSWGTSEDLKEMIRGLVKLSALGRYHRIRMMICIDIVMSPSSAKDIAFVQSTALGNVDCVVSFQLVTPLSMTAAIASTIMRAKVQSSGDVDDAIFRFIGECQAQVSFLLRIASSLTVADALMLLWGRDGKSPRNLCHILASLNCNSSSDAHLRLAAMAPLNQLDS